MEMAEFAKPIQACSLELGGVACGRGNFDHLDYGSSHIIQTDVFSTKFLHWMGNLNHALDLAPEDAALITQGQA